MNRTSDGIKRTFLLYKNGRLTLPTKKAIHLFLFFLSVCVHIGMNVYLIILRLEDNNRGMCWRTRQQQFHRRRSSVAWRIQDHYIFIFQSHTSRGYERRERMYTFIFPRMGKRRRKGKASTSHASI